ncbi:MAG: hypothetical protein HY074_14460 [Deltaproteobacteria bacterium]|nr:hypothetical protein [Deltaproteobacteria bacterium]
MEAKQLFSKTRSWALGIILTAWLVCISGVFGNSGLIQAYQLASVRRDMTLRVKALGNERQYLQSSLYALEHDALVQEQAIRETLGFVRGNELVFEFR